MPKIRVEFWEAKFNRNKDRDAKNRQKLEALGWKVIIVWECELRKSIREESLERLYNEIIGASA